jgi:hypothetical protein
MRLLLLASFLACACKAPAAPDAGTPVERGIDLRMAMTAVFPEYRGASLVFGRAQVTRIATGVAPADLEKARAHAEQSGFKGEPLARPPFVMELSLDGGTLQQDVRIALPPEELGRVLAAPAAMSSESLANWLPKVGTRQRDEFDLELIWVASSVARADFLVWQVTDGALATGWQCRNLPSGWQRERVDGGAVQVPEEFSLTLENPPQGAFIDIDRKGDRAKLRYRLVTFERR